MSITILGVDLPEQADAVVFVNGIKARNVQGLLYMWRNLQVLRTSPMQVDGCMDMKAGIIGPNEFVIVSYWQSPEALKAYFMSEVHRKMMKYFYQHPDSIELYNETYHPTSAGKYTSEHGMAKVYPLVALR